MKRLVSIRRESQLFIVGSACFALGSVPGYASLVGFVADGITFFVGSILFTVASFVQLRLSGRWRSGAWKAKPGWSDWWAAAVQFPGTLFFNVSTGAALVVSVDAATADRYVWRPDAFGSICFLVASALALVATTEKDGLWDPDARTWVTSWLNMAGSVFFGISAVASYVVPDSGTVVNAELVNSGTFLGAICFLGAAYLLPPPTSGPPPARTNPAADAEGGTVRA